METKIYIWSNSELGAIYVLGKQNPLRLSELKVDPDKLRTPIASSASPLQEQNKFYYCQLRPPTSLQMSHDSKQFSSSFSLFSFFMKAFETLFVERGINFIFHQNSLGPKIIIGPFLWWFNFYGLDDFSFMLTIGDNGISKKMESLVSLCF